MKNAEEIIAGFYHHIKNSEVPGKHNNEVFIHKLNYLILFNPVPTAKDWVASMVSYASKPINPDGPVQTADGERNEFDAVIEILCEHYNSLVAEDKKLSAQMFESARNAVTVVR